jgi:hypothetical protein
MVVSGAAGFFPLFLIVPEEVVIVRKSFWVGFWMAD